MCAYLKKKINSFSSPQIHFYSLKNSDFSFKRKKKDDDDGDDSNDVYIIMSPSTADPKMAF